MKRKILKVVSYLCYITSLFTIVYISGCLYGITNELATINLECPKLNTYWIMLLVASALSIVSYNTAFALLNHYDNSKTK